MELEVGHRIKVCIQDEPGEGVLEQAMRDGAKVVELREDGDHLVKCDTYTDIAQDGTGNVTEILPLSYFVSWKMEE